MAPAEGDGGLRALGLEPRAAKPRDIGLTQVLDRGLSLGQLRETLVAGGRYVDLVKLGWGTCCVAPDLRAKARLARDHGVRIGAGGTLTEIAAARGRADALLAWLADVEMDVVEVSDGLGRLGPRKRDLIRAAAGRFIVVAEVGWKAPDRPVDVELWIAEAIADLEAGADYVLIEGRESGTVGAFHGDGSPRIELVEGLVEALPVDRVIFEAPRSAQQAWFVRRLGPEVNLGNIPPGDAIALETLRLGLRADTAGCAHEPGSGADVEALAQGPGLEPG